MRKIMFSDKYGLTAAVLAGTKTQTRRIIEAMPKEPKIAYCLEDESGHVHLLDGYTVVAKSRFKIGEVVAVAQPYRDIDGKSDKYLNEWAKIVACNGMNTAGYNNKMFVRAELMPHKIEITGIQVQRLQDISNDDCLAEGIDIGIDDDGRTIWKYYDSYYFDSPKDAYASLIDKISGKGTWERNPYVFVYEFKLISDLKKRNNMRTIKFRGQCTNDSRYAGEWVTGGLVVCEKSDVLIISAITDTVMCKYHVKPETVGQFTGLLDKTGKEIFEGDIVKDINDELQQVRWLCSGWGLQRLSDGEKSGWCVVPGYDKEREFVEIIGNIHDNPELLSK